MASVFDLKKLEKLLRDFYNITGIRITVFDPDVQEILSYPVSRSDFCRLIRADRQGEEACRKCDSEACRKAFQTREMVMYRCHAGLTEAFTPLVVQERLVGYLAFGQVLSYTSHEEGWQAIRKRTEKLPVSPEKLREIVLEKKLVEEDFVRSASQILLAVASYLVMERMAVLQSDSLAVRLDRYLDENFTGDVRTAELCERFSIGKTRLYQLSRELYGCGIGEHIRDLRLRYARSLLLSEERIPLNVIAERCGYGDYNYFISIFSRAMGCSPHRWRERHSAGRE